MINPPIFFSRTLDSSIEICAPKAFPKLIFAKATATPPSLMVFTETIFFALICSEIKLKTDFKAS